MISTHQVPLDEMVPTATILAHLVEAGSLTKVESMMTKIKAYLSQECPDNQFTDRELIVSELESLRLLELTLDRLVVMEAVLDLGAVFIAISHLV